MVAQSGDCRLGCPETTVAVTDRCAVQPICDIGDQVATTEYGRVMDDTSEATIVINKAGGAAGESCCDCLGGLRTWIHSLAIYRDGELAWGPGPIVNILEKGETFTFKVRDVSAWLDKRRIHNDYNFVNTPVLEIAETIIRDALSVDDPCNLLANLVIIPPTGDPTRIDKQYTANTTKAGDALRELARTVLDFTVIGASIILAESLNFGPFGVLTDDDFLVDLEVEERGLEAATDWQVNGSGVTGHAGGIDPFYGLLEEVAAEENVTSAAQAQAGAAGRLDASNPAPLYLNIPDGAGMHPDASVCFETLVPGALYDVLVTNLCREVNQQMRLTNVKVQTSSTGEQVGVTLSPIGINYTDASQQLSPGSGLS